MWACVRKNSVDETEGRMRQTVLFNGDESSILILQAEDDRWRVKLRGEHCKSKNKKVDRRH